MNFGTNWIFGTEKNTPFSKAFWMENGQIMKNSYPNFYLLNSEFEDCTSLQDFYKTLVAHAKLGHALLKGQLSRPLVNESRKGTTQLEAKTNWICLDLDGIESKSVKDFLNPYPFLAECAHIVQYSSSYKIGTDTKLRCHVIFGLSAELPAPVLKPWLMHLNLNYPTTRKAITLSRTGNALHWPVDITSCQNDRLIYVAPPTLEKNVPCGIKAAERIQYIPGKNPVLDVKHITHNISTQKLKDEARELLNALRKDIDLKPFRSSTTTIKEYEVQKKPGEATITGMREDRGFVYFNLNGGDSWGYYHPSNNFEFIHNFKGEPSYYTKELLPEYYREHTSARNRCAPLIKTEEGKLILAFRDKRTANYWNGTLDLEEQKLELYPARSELQLAHWMENHGLMAHETIPVMSMEFNPHQEEIYNDDDETNIKLNTWTPSSWLKQEWKKPKDELAKAPLISRIIKHAVSGGEDNETLEHFLNWLAVIFQLRCKPKTAWVLHGTEGTGKGLMIAKILKPLLGERYVVTRRASELEEKFNGWLEQALIAFIDEIEVSTSSKKDIISGDLRNFITEDWVTLRHMNRAAVEALNYTGFIFSSNKTPPIQINERDRRYNIGMFQTERLAITQEEIDEQITTELPVFMAYIMTRPASKAIAAQILHNADHKRIVEANYTSLDTLSQQLREGDFMELWDARTDPKYTMEIHGTNTAFAHAYNGIMERELHKIYAEGYNAKNKAQTEDTIIKIPARLKRDELLIIFEHCVGNTPKTTNKFTALLKHRNIPTKRMRFDDTTAYGFETIWKVTLKWLLEHIAHESKIQEMKVKRIK